MIKVVSWNISKREQPWRELAQMADDGEADLVLLQEAGSPPGDLVHRVEYEDAVFWNRQLYDRWPLVVKLSEKIKLEPYRQVPPISELGCEAIGVSGIGTIAAARVIPRESKRGLRRCIDVRALVEASSVDRKPLERWLLRCLGTSNHFGHVGFHWSHRPVQTQDSGGRRSEHVLRGDRQKAVTAGTRMHSLESHESARTGIPGTAGSTRSESGNSAGRRAVRHEKHTDVPQ